MALSAICLVACARLSDSRDVARTRSNWRDLTNGHLHSPQPSPRPRAFRISFHERCTSLHITILELGTTGYLLPDKDGDFVAAPHRGRYWETLSVSGKLSTYPSPKPTVTLTSHLGQNIGRGVGVGGQFLRNA